MSPVCFVFISIAFYYFEYDQIPWERVFSNEFMGCLVLNGTVAFSLNIAVILLIKNSSAFILAMSGIMKVSAGVWMY